jgi:SAM-dependent methyltransferase
MMALEAANPLYKPDAEELRDRLVQRAGMVVELETFAPRRGRLLDIGCNRGLLLRAAVDLGWEAVGVELEPAAAELARVEASATVYESIALAARHERPFDLVVAWHVLEHAYDPVRFLRDAATTLARDGVIALQTPSFTFVDEWRRRGRTSDILCAVHTLYFTLAGFESVIGRAGLRPVAIEDSADELLLTAVCVRSESTVGVGGPLRRWLRPWLARSRARA